MVWERVAASPADGDAEDEDGRDEGAADDDDDDDEEEEERGRLGFSKNV